MKKRYPPFTLDAHNLPNTRHPVKRSSKYFAKNAIDDLIRGHAKSSSALNAQSNADILNTGSYSTSRRPSASMIASYPFLNASNRSRRPSASMIASYPFLRVQNSNAVNHYSDRPHPNSKRTLKKQVGVGEMMYIHDNVLGRYNPLKRRSTK